MKQKLNKWQKSYINKDGEKGEKNLKIKIIRSQGFDFILLIHFSNLIHNSQNTSKLMGIWTQIFLYWL